MRLIDADEAVKAVHDEFDECLVWDESGETTANEFENIILQIPTVDPVKHGRWIDMGDLEQCSVCYGTRPKEVQSCYGKMIWLRTPYCPECGAKMDEVEDGLERK